MRWLSPRSRTVALAGITLYLFVGEATLPVHGQDTTSPAVPAPDSELAKALDDLDRSITQRLDAGQIAEAVPTAREKLDLLERKLGKDHWQACDARRDLETYQRLSGLPREVRDRYGKA